MSHPDMLQAAIATALRELADDNDYIFRPPTYWTDRAARLLAHPDVVAALAVPTTRPERLQMLADHARLRAFARLREAASIEERS